MSMEIHGVRIYPKSVQVVQGKGAPIFVHGRVDDRVSDFFYIFRPTARLWKSHLFVNDFGVTYGSHGKIEDPLPELREQYGFSLVDADVKTQLLLLRGDDFYTWAAHFYAIGGAFLPILREPVSFNDLKRLYWDSTFQLTSDTWPAEMRAVLHMWDDIYWQLFSTERSDIDFLIQAHAGDPNLGLYYVEFDKEYPNPSNTPLQPVTHGT